MKTDITSIADFLLFTEALTEFGEAEVIAHSQYETNVRNKVDEEKVEVETADGAMFSAWDAVIAAANVYAERRIVREVEAAKAEIMKSLSIAAAPKSKRSGPQAVTK